MFKLSSISSAILSIRDNDCALWVFSASCICQDANRVCRMYISANRENLIFFIGDLLHVKSLFLAEQSERKHIERTGISKYKSEGSRLAT